MSNSNETSVDLKDIVRTIVKRFYIVVLLTALGSGAGWYYGKQQVYTYYNTKMTLIVGNAINSNGTSYNIEDLPKYQSYLETYAALITNETILDHVVTKLNLQVSPLALSSSIKAVPQPNTQFIDIYFNWSNSNETYTILKAVTREFQDQVKILYPQINISVFDDVKIPQMVIAGEPKKYWILGTIGGFVASILLIFVIDFLKDVFDETDENERKLKTKLKQNKKNKVPKISEEESSESKTMNLENQQNIDVDLVEIPTLDLRFDKEDKLKVIQKNQIV